MKKWEDNRTFKNFYPSYFEGDIYLKQNHGIKFTQFQILNNNHFTFGIESPSVKYFNERKYHLNLNILERETDVTKNHFSGIFGESLMRVIVNEFLRRNQNKLYISNFDFLKFKKNKIPIASQNQNERSFLLRNNIQGLENIILPKKDIELKGINRYNLSFNNINEDFIISEFDGFLEYKTKYGIKGIIICESKIGKLGIYGKAISQKSAEKIYQRLINPSKTIFKGYQIDFLIMGSKPNIIDTSLKNKRIRKNIEALYHLLKKNNIGLIVQTFPLTRNKIEQMGSNIFGSYKYLKPDNLKGDQFKAIESENNIYILDGKRVKTVLTKTGKDTFQITYNN